MRLSRGLGIFQKWAQRGGSILSEEYKIKMTEAMEGRIEKMCNYSQGVLKSGYDSGYGTGYGTGYDSGYGSGYGTGYDTGYGSGYGSGYDTGYDSGDEATSKLFSKLIASNRMDDLKRAAEDREYRRKLMNELFPV